jgi:hypothetical protein
LAKLSERVRLSLGSANSFCVSMRMRTFGSDLILGWNNRWIEWVKNQCVSVCCSASSKGQKVGLASLLARTPKTVVGNSETWASP